MKNKKASLDQINLAGSIRETQTTDLVELMRSSHVNPLVPTAVAFSGGADSTALLIASADYWKLHSQAAGTLTPLRAVHIHHGLQAAADSFAEHCTSVCDRLQVPLHIEYIKASHRLGESPEEAARLARYKAFASVLSKEWGGEVRTVLLGSTLTIRSKHYSWLCLGGLDYRAYRVWHLILSEWAFSITGLFWMLALK